MKHLILIITACVLSSCSFVSNSSNGVFNTRRVELSGIQTVKEIKVENFNKISSDIPVTIIYSDGRQHISAAMPEDAFDYVEFNVKSNTLHIQTNGVRLVGLQKAVISLSLPELNGITLNGAGKFLADKGMRSSEFAVKINGSGDIRTSNTKIEDLELRINGSGNIDFEELRSEDIEIHINGSGNIKLSGNSKDVDVHINGSGNIDLRGLDTDTVSSSINGSGKVLSK